MKNWKRTLFIGFVWGGFFFLWWLSGFLSENWNFHLFSFKSWHYLFSEFSEGWIISSVSDWIFLFTIVLAVPLFVYVWRLLLTIQWRKTYQRIVSFVLSRWRKTRAEKKVVKIATTKSHKKQRPRPMNRVAKAPTEAAPTPTPVRAAPKPTSQEFKTSLPEDDAIFGQMRLPDETKHPSFSEETPSPTPPEESQQISVLREDLSALLIKAGYKVVKDAVIEKLPVRYVAFSGETVLVCVPDFEKGEWLADEERFNGEDPLWFSESDHRTSPIFRLLTACEKFSARLTKAGISLKVVPMFVVAAGTIINAEDILPVWQEAGVLVCRTGEGGPELLTGFEKTLPPAQGSVSNDVLERARDLF